MYLKSASRAGSYTKKGPCGPCGNRIRHWCLQVLREGFGGRVLAGIKESHTSSGNFMWVHVPDFRYIFW
jgi:hypothetical protein